MAWAKTDQIARWLLLYGAGAPCEKAPDTSNVPRALYEPRLELEDLQRAESCSKCSSRRLVLVRFKVFKMFKRFVVRFKLFKMLN